MTILSRHEGKTLEFKRDLSSPDGVLRALVAFANTSGGILMTNTVGVNNEIITGGTLEGATGELTLKEAAELVPVSLPAASRAADCGSSPAS